MIGEVTSYTDLVGAIRERLAVLQIRYEDFDTLAGFPERLTGKVLGPAQVKRLGPEKMFDAIRAAGLRIRLEVDPEQEKKMLARIAKDFLPRQGNQARYSNHASVIGTHILSRALGHILRKARAKRWEGKTAKERSDSARHAATQRWINHRKWHKRSMKASRTRRKRLALLSEGTSDEKRIQD